MSVSYRNTDIVDGDSFGKGSRTVLIRNNGVVGGSVTVSVTAQ